MFHVRSLNQKETNSHYTAVKRHVLNSAADAGNILRYLAEKNVTVLFVKPEGISNSFNNAAVDAGSLSVLGNSIFIDMRKTLEQQADDLLRRTRALIGAPKPTRTETFLYQGLGVVYGRMMRLEDNDGFRI